MSNTRSSPRVTEIDALRGVAAFAVVLFHYTTRYEELYGHGETIHLTASQGCHGVTLFFMISGYVIFMSLDRARSVWQFVVSRFCRLYPTYWASACITYLVVMCFGLPDRQYGFGVFVVNLTMLQEVFNVPSIDGVYWSLLVELYFYAVMATIVGCGGKKYAIVVLGVGNVLAICFNSFVHVPADSFLVKYLPLFMIGMALYQSSVHRMGRGWLLVLGGLIAIGLLAGTKEGLLPVVVCALLVYGASRGRLPMLRMRPLVWCGGISYALYLTHQNIGYVVLNGLSSFEITGDVAVVVACAMSVLLAAGLTYGVEKPANAMLRRRLRISSERPGATNVGGVAFQHVATLE